MLTLLWLWLALSDPPPPEYTWTGPGVGEVTVTGPGLLTKIRNGRELIVAQITTEGPVTIAVPTPPVDIFFRPQEGDRYCMHGACAIVGPRVLVALPLVSG